jgi:hypothetical protein
MRRTEVRPICSRRAISDLLTKADGIARCIHWEASWHSADVIRSVGPWPLRLDDGVLGNWADGSALTPFSGRSARTQSPGRPLPRTPRRSLRVYSRAALFFDHTRFPHVASCNSQRRGYGVSPRVARQTMRFN